MDEAELRREAAAADLRIFSEHGPEDDLDELIEWTSKHLQLDD